MKHEIPSEFLSIYLNVYHLQDKGYIAGGYLQQSSTSEESSSSGLPWQENIDWDHKPQIQPVFGAFTEIGYL